MITPAFNLTATERVLPKLALDFTTASLDPRVTFTRTTGATYTNSSGYIADSSSNAPRFDYDPISLTCKGLLIEESRTNLCYPSDTFGSPWFNNGSFTDTNATTAPTGTAVGSKLREGTTTGTHATSFGYTKAIGVPISFSVYAKSDQRTRIRITVDAGYGNVTFDLSNGTIVAGSNGTITSVGNGWYRCSISKTTQYGAATQCVISLVSTGTTNSYTGIANYGAFIWGAQFEDGAFATSYIPTVASQVTRTADVATMTGTNFSDWFNASEGSFEFVGDLPALFNGPTFLKADNGTENERYFLYGNASFSPTMIVTDGGVAQASRSSGTIVANTQFTTVYGYKLNDFGISTNAGSVQTDTAGTLPTVSQLGIGCNSITPSAFMNGHVAKVFYWPQKLTSNEIRAFSK